MLSINSPIQWKSKTDMVYTALREAIICGEVEPGERVVLSKIAQDMGVSVIPVREAVKQLEAEGLLELVNGEVTVSRLSEKDFHELSSIRVVLEGYATYLSAKRVNNELLTALNELVIEMEKCIDKGEFRGYGIINSKFHESLYSICGNDHLIKLIQSLTIRTDRARAVFVYDKQRVSESLREHKEIITALTQGDYEKAKELIAEQTRTSFDRFITYKAKIER
ncbi:MAG: GntR family transcriptional regulator [Desulfitobacterium hafniense]|nr:GntR family transcriptional regulator [Desulfitobacterium hafniense]